MDCIFPANLTDYDADTLGVVMSPPLMSSDMYTVVRNTERQSFVNREQVTAAVTQGNPNYQMFLLDHFPDWEVSYYPDTSSCLDAVAEGTADCILISSYHFNNIAKQCERLHLTTLPSGVDMNYCFATRKGDTALYSILAKAAGLVPASTVNSALNYYSTEDARVSVGEFIREHLAAVIAIIAAVVIVILALILHNVRSEQRASAAA